MAQKEGALLRILWGIGICVVLAGAAILTVQFIGKRMKSPEPFLDAVHGQSSTSQAVTPPDTSAEKLRFAIATMLGAEATFSTYRQFVSRIARDIGRDGAFVVRPSYKEVRLALANNQVDLALIGTGTYLRGLDSKGFNLLVQPKFTEGREYRALLLVPADSQIRSWEALRNRVMAYTDPESFSGCLLPAAELMNRGQNPDSYFRQIIYTGSHDHSISAVSNHVADAAAVMSLVWHSAVEKRPSLEKQTRIIWESPIYGPPLIVAAKNLDRKLEAALRDALLALHTDEEGRQILSAIGIERFVPVDPNSYATARKVYRHYQKWLSEHD